MGSLIVSSEALKNAAAEIRKRSLMWQDETDRIDSEECRNIMNECGSIITEYSVLLEKISREYEESEKRISSFSGDIYEQL